MRVGVRAADFVGGRAVHPVATRRAAEEIRWMSAAACDAFEYVKVLYKDRGPFYFASGRQTLAFPSSAQLPIASPDGVTDAVAGTAVTASRPLTQATPFELYDVASV